MRKLIASVVMVLAALILTASCKPQKPTEGRSPSPHTQTAIESLTEQNRALTDKVAGLEQALAEAAYENEAVAYEELSRHINFAPTDEHGGIVAGIGVDCDDPYVWCDDEGR